MEEIEDFKFRWSLSILNPLCPGMLDLDLQRLWAQDTEDLDALEVFYFIISSLHLLIINFQIDLEYNDLHPVPTTAYVSQICFLYG